MCAGADHRRAWPGVARPAATHRAATFPEGALGVLSGLRNCPDGETDGDIHRPNADLRVGERGLCAAADVVTVESRSRLSDDPARERHPSSSRSPADIAGRDPRRRPGYHGRFPGEAFLPGDRRRRSASPPSFPRPGRLQERESLGDALVGLLLLSLTGHLPIAALGFSPDLLRRPFVVMAIVPFGLVGTIYGHAVLGGAAQPVLPSSA